MHPKLITHKAMARAQWFNRAYPVGTPVEYWTGAREGVGKVSRTRSIATVLGGHTAVVWVAGEAGCIALSHVEPITTRRAS